MHNREEVMRHLTEDQKYPATKEEILAECDNLSDIDEEDKTVFKENLPEGTYQSAGDVMSAIGMKAETQTA